MCVQGAGRGAGPTRPAGPEGLGRKAAAAAAGERGKAGGEARGLPARGYHFWGKFLPRGEEPACRRPSSGRLFPGKQLASLGFISCSVGAGSTPTALCSRFAFQIMLRLAFW